MGDVVSDGTSFSCPLCTGKLKIKVPSSSAEGDAKKLANTGNYLFPPPGAQCLLIPNAPAPCAPPSVSTVDPGQSPIQIDGKKALGADCKLQCAKSGLLTVASPGQSSAQHDGASEGGGIDIWDVIDIATWLIPGVQEVKAATLLGRIALRARKIYQAIRGAKKIAPKDSSPARTPRPASTPVGSKRDPHQNTPYQKTRNVKTEIGGRTYSGHALDQMQNRGITPTVVDNTIKNGSPAVRIRNGLKTTNYYDKSNNITAVVNGKNEVITVGHGKIGR